MTLWTIQSMEFSRPEYWSGQPFPFPGDFSNPGTKPRSPAFQVDSLPAEPQGKPKNTGMGSLSLLQWIFLAQESNQGLLHCRQILYQLSYQGSPYCRLIDHKFMGFSGLSIMFHGSTCHFLHQNHAILIIVALQYSLNTDRITTSYLFYRKGKIPLFQFLQKNQLLDPWVFPHNGHFIFSCSLQNLFCNFCHFNISVLPIPGNSFPS